MTKSGNPLVGKVDKVEGYINAVGMSGQGFMLAPSLGELINRIVQNKTTPADDLILSSLTPKNGFLNEEVLK